VKTALYPRTAAIRPRPTPVLPEVASTIVPPGFSSPLFSAPSIIAIAARSLMLKPGLRYSTFPKNLCLPLGTTLWSSTIGVLPISSKTLL